MRDLITNIVGCSLIKVIISILIPEGKVKKFCVDIISIILMFVMIEPILSFFK